ncbi:hypothetical protein [Mucilaginibacter sp.]|uniref:hypothetical protein n=1 Tax=Mucilaginibacter sp. TaxID=1882438 RepID=UPI002611D646|nr:hypothetical protein [Mucilaginibacter sp.]MDB4924435.1 hypothetical protein [Mucilaginibacter sp.]
METTTGKLKSKKSGRQLATVDQNEKIRRKAKTAATNESNVAAELRNREHGGEQPAR